ncbi:MAG: hypothetical protein P1Q69_20200, partial [Candidatus Thorarchaeota archaeon]|nr:hypothetical protein [Candidatus Thorarchaeota archaeon]
YTYLKMAIDNVYAMEYENKWAEMEVNHAKMKPIMITVGIGMVLLGATQIAAASLPTAGLAAFTGVPTMLFGIDMIGSNLFGFSALDEILKAGLYGVTAGLGQDTKFIKEEGFSFFRFTSNPIRNLILTQLTFLILGEVLTAGGGLRGLARQMAVGTYGGTEVVEIMVNGQITTTKVAIQVSATQVLEMGFFDCLRHLGTLPGRQLESIVRYLVSQIVHMGSGTLFLFALGATGTLGEGGFLGDLLIQGAMLSSIMISLARTYQMRKISPADMLYQSAIKPTSKLIHFFENMKRMTSATSASNPLWYRTSIFLGLLSQSTQVMVAIGSMNV